MELQYFLLFVFVIYSSVTQGSSAVTDVFVKRGDDVLLEVMDDVLEEFALFAWKFNTSNNLVTYSPGGKARVYGGYTGRVEFSEGNYSVKLKNLQDDDSGVYTAQVTVAKDQTIATYMVRVEGPVSPVDLNPDSVSISSDSCKLTVTCSTEDSHINSTFTCDTKTCSQEGGDQSKVTNSGASLRVHLLNGAIICNHSNHVSWMENRTQIQDFCPLHPGSEHQRNHIITMVIAGIAVIAGVVPIIVVPFYCHHNRGKYDRENKENTEFTEYAAVETPYNQNQRSADGDSTNPPTSIYSLAGPATGNKGSTKTKTNSQPESLYATVDKPSRR